METVSVTPSRSKPYEIRVSPASNHESPPNNSDFKLPAFSTPTFSSPDNSPVKVPYRSLERSAPTQLVFGGIESPEKTPGAFSTNIVLHKEVCTRAVMASESITLRIGMQRYLSELSLM